jgi:hypothetical protein
MLFVVCPFNNVGVSGLNGLMVDQSEENFDEVFSI